MFIKVEDIDLHAAIPRQVHLALTKYVQFWPLMNCEGALLGLFRFLTYPSQLAACSSEQTHEVKGKRAAFPDS